MTVTPAANPRRIGLALIAGIDLVALAWTVYATAPSQITRTDAPAFLVALGGQPAVLAGLVTVGLYALVEVARGRSTIAWALVALAALALLSESHAALVGGAARSFYASGALLAGWTFGLAYARQLDVPDDRAEALAETAARAVLAATYVAASAGKLLAAGTAWADALRLRGVILAQHRVDDGSPLGAMARAVVEHPGLAQALAVATLVIQGGAFLYLAGPRLRVIWGALLLSFHLGVFALTGIPYVEAMALVVLFTIPWRETVAPAAAPARARRALGVAAAIVLALALLAWLLPIHGYTGAHHRGRGARLTPAPAAAPRPSATRRG